jgi:hypothetical protein
VAEKRLTYVITLRLELVNARQAQKLREHIDSLLMLNGITAISELSCVMSVQEESDG